MAACGLIAKGRAHSAKRSESGEELRFVELSVTWLRRH
jgi:hypothetical protein